MNVSVRLGSVLIAVAIEALTPSTGESQVVRTLFDISGIIRSEVRGDPVEDAAVDLLVDTTSTAIQRVRSDTAGRFTLKELSAGDYWLRVRRLGYGPVTRQLHVPPVDSSVVVALSHASPHAQEEAKTVEERRKRLAEAQSRPRRWTCEGRAALTAHYAQRWLYLSKAARDPEGDSDAKKWQIPPDSDRFIAEFRPISNPAECARIARNLDASYGLVDDHVVVYRIGNVLVLPTLQAFADTTGKVHSVIVY